MKHVFVWLILGGLLADPAQGQDVARARRTIDTLASATMFGRGYTQGGDKKAAAYIEARFQALGLRPLAAAGYQQPFTLDVNTFPNRVSLAVAGQALAPGLDFIVNPVSGKGAGGGALYFLDTLLFADSPAVAREKFLKTNLNGKIAVFYGRHYYKLLEMPAEFLQHLAQAKAYIGLETKLTMAISPQALGRPWFQVLASRWPLPYANGTVSRQKAKFKLDAQPLVGYATQNVAAQVRGTRQPERYVVFTAHYDHLGGLGRQVYFPGANDNASGVSLLLELAAHFAQNPPPYSVAFIAFSGEEAGLVGSKYYVEHPLFPLRQIRFLLNIDLAGSGDEGIGLVNATVHEAEFARFKQISEANNYFRRILRRGAAANSDHYYFGQAGVRSFFVYTLGGITAYHDVHDRADKIPLTKYAELFGLLRDFSLQLMD
ncbi:MAG: M28 family peptidase [Bernardetiaceae bacterium]|nr:M28 family peptidase [Bernardetiaceae bacterium]